MLSIRRIALTAAAAAALAAPAAQAKPVDVPPRLTDKTVDHVTPDARDQRRVSAPLARTVAVPSNDGFEWGDAAIGGGAGAALAFVLLIGGGALTVRPPRAPAPSR